MPAGGFVSTRKRSATNNLKLAESAKKAKVGAATELESQILLLSTQNAALLVVSYRYFPLSSNVWPSVSKEAICKK